MIFIPALALIGFVVSATVYRLKASIICPGFTPIPASWKTSHGPAKSIMTAPSEITKATGILPSVGGFSELTGEMGLFPSGTGSAIEMDFAMDSGIADAKLSAAAPFSNSLLFMAFVSSPFLRTRQRLRNCERDATPALALSLELPSAGFCQPVILRPPAVGNYAARTAREGQVSCENRVQFRTLAFECGHLNRNCRCAKSRNRHSDAGTLWCGKCVYHCVDCNQTPC